MSELCKHCGKIQSRHCNHYTSTRLFDACPVYKNEMFDHWHPTNRFTSEGEIDRIPPCPKCGEVHADDIACPTNPQPEYRELGQDEVIQEGDEMRMTPEIPDPWAVIKRSGAAIGCKPSDHLLRHDFQFRRRISETAGARACECGPIGGKHAVVCPVNLKPSTPETAGQRRERVIEGAESERQRAEAVAGRIVSTFYSKEFSVAREAIDWLTDRITDALLKFKEDGK